MQAILRCFCKIVLVLAIAANATGQSAVIDRTGSLFDQRIVESELEATLPAAAIAFPAIRIVFFSDQALQAPAILVKFDQFDVQSDFGNVVDAAKNRAVRQAKLPIRNAFKTAVPPPAKVSNIPAAIKRTADDSSRGLLVTDGDNEAPAPKGPVTIKAIFVVLCSAKRDDPANELVIYERRRQQIVIWAPNAKVFPCFQLRNAVIAWTSDAPITTLAKDVR